MAGRDKQEDIMRDKYGRFIKGHTERKGWKPTKKTREKIRQKLRKGWYIKCLHCKKAYYISPCKPKYGRDKFCSIKCSSTFHKKDKVIHSYGYVLVNMPEHPYCDINGRVREHRLVIERQTGLYLLPKEDVHHLGRKNDNRPEKLMAFVSKSAHQRFERGGQVRKSEIIFDGRKLKRSNKNGNRNSKVF